MFLNRYVILQNILRKLIQFVKYQRYALFLNPFDCFYKPLEKRPTKNKNIDRSLAFLSIVSTDDETYF